jgi:hypothetical protein
VSEKICKRCNGAWNVLELQLVIMGPISMMAIITVMIVGELVDEE